MGQSYWPIIIRQRNGKNYKLQYHPHTYGQGYKLLEHGYVGNVFAETVLSQLYHRPGRLFWCGDYYKESDFDGDYLGRSLTPEDFKLVEQTWNRHSRLSAKFPHPKEVRRFSEDKVVVNHDFGIYIDMKKWIDDHCDEDRLLHPLVLLTAIGNGRGGGDYEGVNEDDVGLWAGATIEILDEAPEGYSDVTDDAWFCDER